MRMLNMHMNEHDPHTNEWVAGSRNAAEKRHKKQTRENATRQQQVKKV